jgi:hypothetical protein
VRWAEEVTVKKSRCVLIAIAALCLGQRTILHAAAGEETGRKAIGQTTVQLVVVRNPVSFLHSWDAPNRDASPPIPAVDSLKRETEFGVGVVFSDCLAGKDGKCSLFATYSIRTVAGAELVSMPNVPVWREIPPPRGRLELGKGLWRTSSEASDPLGPYIYRAVVRDDVSGKSVTLERKISLVE